MLRYQCLSSNTYGYTNFIRHVEPALHVQQSIRKEEIGEEDVNNKENVPPPLNYNYDNW